MSDAKYLVEEIFANGFDDIRRYIENNPYPDRDLTTLTVSTGMKYYYVLVWTKKPEAGED